MRMPTRFSLTAAGLLCISSAFAQVLLKEQDVTEEALISALAPRPAGVVSRNIGVVGGRVGTRVSGPRTASVLVTFETNSTELSAQARDALDVVARALQSESLAPLKFQVEGHADPRGKSDANLRLSQDRALAVRKYLVENHSIPLERLESIGKGDRDPLNKSDISAPENRRVTFVTLTN
jgi:OmpA-OmpF porin, OOP family